MASHTLELHANKKLRDFSVRIRTEVPRGVVVVLGPSGHGKTTILNMIAGVTEPDWGIIRLGGRTLFDSDRGINIPIEHRNIGYLFQDYALFPHLSVFENTAFGLRARKVPSDAIKSRVMRELERLEIASLQNERPRRLSAGQRQRVALARVLVTEPST